MAEQQDAQPALPRLDRLPSAWLSKLITAPDNDDDDDGGRGARRRATLFRTCRALACMVAAHAPLRRLQCIIQRGGGGADSPPPSDWPVGVLPTRSLDLLAAHLPADLQLVLTPGEGCIINDVAMPAGPPPHHALASRVRSLRVSSMVVPVEALAGMHAALPGLQRLHLDNALLGDEEHGIVSGGDGDDAAEPPRPEDVAPAAALRWLRFAPCGMDDALHLLPYVVQLASGPALEELEVDASEDSDAVAELLRSLPDDWAPQLRHLRVQAHPRMGDDDGGGELLEALLQNPRLARVPRVTLTDFTNAVFEASMSDGGEEGAGLLHGVEWQHVVLDGEVIPQVLLPEVLPPLSKEGGQAGGAWGNPRRVAVLAGTTTTSAHFTNAEALQVLLANQGRVEVRPAPPPEWLRLAQREQVLSFECAVDDTAELGGLVGWMLERSQPPATVLLVRSTSRECVHVPALFGPLRQCPSVHTLVLDLRGLGLLPGGAEAGAAASTEVLPDSVQHVVLVWSGESGASVAEQLDASVRSAAAKALLQHVKQLTVLCRSAEDWAGHEVTRGVMELWMARAWPWLQRVRVLRP